MSKQPTLLGLLTDTQNWMGRIFNRRASQFGITRPQWRVLSGLNGHPGITQTELSELVAIARSPLGKIIDKLEAEGWVERRPDPLDRRVNRLFMTKAFAPVAGPTREISTALEAELLEDFSAPEKRELYRLLNKLRSTSLSLTDDDEPLLKKSRSSS